MPHSCALRGMKLVLFLHVSRFFVKAGPRNSLKEEAFDLLDAKMI